MKTPEHDTLSPRERAVFRLESVEPQLAALRRQRARSARRLTFRLGAADFPLDKPAVM